MIKAKRTLFGKIVKWLLIVFNVIYIPSAIYITPIFLKSISKEMSYFKFVGVLIVIGVWFIVNTFLVSLTYITRANRPKYNKFVVVLQLLYNIVGFICLIGLFLSQIAILLNAPPMGGALMFGLLGISISTLFCIGLFTVGNVLIVLIGNFIMKNFNKKGKR